MEAKPRLLKTLDILTIVLFVIATGMVFLYAPMEVTMGQVQRVFYFHVASAWVGMLGFLVAAVAGIGYLRTGKRSWDNFSLASVEISVVFLLIAIVSGSIWARPIWNTWWTWDPRLTTTTIMVLIYAAYLMLRSGIEDPDRRARFGRGLCYYRFCQCPPDLSVHPYLPHHPSGSDRIWGSDCGRHFRYVHQDATHLDFQRDRFFGHLCEFALAQGAPGRTG
jgi:heme exporter protein C